MRRRLGIMQHLVDDHAVGAVVVQRQRIHVALAQARAEQIPTASSLARASRSISDERSMPIALSARGREQFDHPPGAGADIDQPPDRAGRPAPARWPARPRSRRRGASGSRPTPRHGWRNSARPLRRGRRGRPRAAPRSAANSACAVGLDPMIDHRRTAARCDRRRPASGTPSCLPCAASTSPASPRILTWRETRGWLCPRTCASSPTDNSIARSSATIRSRVGSAKRLEKLGKREASTSRDKDIKISLYPSIKGAADKHCLYSAAIMSIA